MTPPAKLTTKLTTKLKTVNTFFDPTSFPKLKPGVNYFKKSRGSKAFIFVGFNHRGVELDSEIALLVLQLLTGLQSLGNIYQAIAADINSKSEKEVREILEALYQAGFLEFLSSKQPAYIEGKFAAVNLVNFQNRFRSEMNLYSWHPQVSIDRTAESLIVSRRNFSIIIFGRNRLALSLFSILQASGFSQLKIIDRSISPSVAEAIQISPDEVCGLAIRGSDVGVRKTLVIADLARNSQLFAGEEFSFPEIPDFIISTEAIPQETLQRWMSELIPHLAISNLIENIVEVGPIVLPGKTPCLNCLALWRADKFPHFKEFEFLAALDSNQPKGLELPSAQVALLAGIIAIQVIQFCTNQRNLTSPSKLLGASQIINLFDPLDSIQSDSAGNRFRYWQPHISCGCQQLI